MAVALRTEHTTKYEYQNGELTMDQLTNRGKQGACRYYVARTSVLQALSDCAPLLKQHEFELIDILYNRIMNLFDTDQYALYEQVANILSVKKNTSITAYLKEAIEATVVSFTHKN